MKNDSLDHFNRAGFPGACFHFTSRCRYCPGHFPTSTLTYLVSLIQRHKRALTCTTLIKEPFGATTGSTCPRARLEPDPPPQLGDTAGSPPADHWSRGGIMRRHLPGLGVALLLSTCIVSLVWMTRTPAGGGNGEHGTDPGWRFVLSTERLLTAGLISTSPFCLVTLLTEPLTHSLTHSN